MVGLTTEVAQDAELVLDLRPAGDEDERPLDVAEEPAELLQLALEEQARVGGKQLGDADGGRMRPVRGAERVVDEEVEVVRELACELWVVRRLAGVEAGVLQDADPLVGQELPKSCLHRLHRESRVLAFGPPQVRADNDLGGIPLEKQLERRLRGANARVVRDLPILEGHVQVRAHEHSFAADVGVANRARMPQSSRSMRSTRRQLKPHSLSYHPITFTWLPCAIVESPSMMQEAGLPTMSWETIGSSV